MKKELTQEQIITRYLAARPGEWIVSHALEKANLDGHWIGTRGTRTARDLAVAGKFTDIDGTTHYIERRKIGKYAEFRVTSSQQKPKQRSIILPNGEVRIIMETHQQTLERGAKDFAERFEGVMRDLAQE